MTARYLPAIDALRALAVVSVIVYHLHGAWLPGGFAGVDVFFVISGYVISQSMMAFERRSVTGFVAEFYARRMQRILPALLVCLVLAAFVEAMFVPRAWLSDANGHTLRAAVWGFGNVALMRARDSYFSPRIEFNPYAHTWSLGVEEQFYLVFPLVFFLWLATRNRSDRRRFGGIVVLGALGAISLFFCAVVTRGDAPAAYYSLASRWWELAAGGLLFPLRASVRPSRVEGGYVWTLASLALIAVALLHSANVGFPFPGALAAVAGSMGLIWQITEWSSRQPDERWLYRSGAVWIGQRSYSLYLWHWPIFSIFRWTAGLDGAPTRIVAVALTVALAALSYAAVETPFRHVAARRQLSRRAVIATGLASVVLASVATFGIGYLRSRTSWFSLSVTQWQRHAWYPDEWTVDDRQTACRLSRASKPLAGGGTRETYAPDRCDAAPRDRRLFVAGNSHALAYSSMLSRVAVTERVTVHSYLLTGCTFIPLDRTSNQQGPACARYFSELLADIRATMKPGDILFLPSLRLPRLTDQWAQIPDSVGLALLFAPAAANARAAALREASTSLAPLARDGLTVILEAPKPLFRSPAFRCSDWFNRGNPVCTGGTAIPRDLMLHYRAPVLAAMTTLASTDQNIVVWDPFPALCPQATCRAVPDGVPLYFDGDHLSNHANDVLYPSFAALVRQIISTQRAH